MTTTLAVYAAIVATAGLIWQIWTELRRRKRVVEIEVSHASAPLGGEDTGNGPARANWYELCLIVINRGESPIYVRELSIDCVSTAGALGYVEVTQDQLAVEVQSGEHRAWKRLIDERDEMWSEGFIVSATLSTGEEILTDVQWLDASLIEIVRTDALTGRRAT